MPKQGIEPNHPTQSEPNAELGFDDDSFGQPETTETEKDDDPASENDFPVPFGSDLKAD